jgi:uncharacterized repeat protein (TIGR03803 family)/VCBS repeat-containing protein
MAFVESTSRSGIFTSRATVRVRASRWLLAIVTLMCAVAWPVHTEDQIDFAVVTDFGVDNPGQLFTGLTRGNDGLLYGVGFDGGAAAKGSVFRVSEQGSVTVLHEFTGSDGSSPFAHLVKAPDGSLYGTTVTGGNGRGTVFKIATDGSFVPVYAFTDDGMDQTDGMSPYGSLAIDADGTVYGVTSQGGANSGGTLFKIVNGSFSVVHAFGAVAPGGAFPTGSAPMGGLAWGADGRLYGTTTAGGGADQRGTIFSYDPATGTVTDEAAFTQATGYFPRSELLLASDGNLYGTAVGEGAGGFGTVFRFVPQTLQISPIHAFANQSDGGAPYSSLIQGGDQSLYGTANMGGDGGVGTLFRIALDSTFTFTTLHWFDYAQPGGVSPSAGLVETTPGTFYGATPWGDTNLPVVYRLTIGQENHVPVATSFALGATEDTAASGTLNASDADHDSLTFSLVSNGSKGTATLTNAATGAFTYTPKPNANGSDSFTFKVNDGKADSNVATVTVTIDPVNDAPVASNGAASVVAGSSTSGVLSASDIDSASLTYSLVANGSKGSAVVTNAATGAFSYTANADASGTDTFTFKASDGQRASNVATMTVTIQSAGRLEGLVALDGALTLPEDGRGRSAVHATDSKHRRLVYQLVSGGRKGWVHLDGNSGQFLYLPKRNANGEDRFTFRARAGNQWSNVATVLIHITPVNDAPHAWGPCVHVLRRGQTSGKIQAVDPDGDPLTFSVAKAPKFGTVTLTATGGFTYAADGTRNHDAFTVKVSDPSGASALVRVVVLRR